MITPRNYQTWAVDSIFDYFSKKSGNPLVGLITGSGKSVCIAMFIKRVISQAPRTRFLCLTHVKELIGQNYNKFMEVWPSAPAGIYSAGLKKKESHHPITFGGIGSIVNKEHLFGHIDLIIIDEAHLVSPDDETMYQKVINRLLEVNPNLKVIGFTATPWRMGHGKLTDNGIFTDMCCDMTTTTWFNWFLSEGYIVPVVPINNDGGVNVAKLPKRGGEFVMGTMQQAFDKDEITKRALDKIIEQGANRRHWLIFASGVEHAIHITEMLNLMGVSAKVVHSKMKNSERDENIAGFKNGDFRALVNNGILTTGFDFPALDLIALIRATESVVLFVQILGRGTRPLYSRGFDLSTREGRLAAIQASPKKNTLVLDFANNAMRLGPINDPVIPTKKGEKGGEAPVKLCENCDMVNHASVRFCANCGEEFIFKVKIVEEASTVNLIKADIPIVEIFDVSHVTYAHHKPKNKDKADCLRISYHCANFRLFEEYKPFDHANPQVRNKAIRWWVECSGSLSAPDSVAEAMRRTGELRSPTQIRVHTNKQYPEILHRTYPDIVRD